MNESFLFLKRFFSSPKAIGSLLPSSKKLGSCMVQRSASGKGKPKRILEIGAGSGALTRPLVEKLRPTDFLDIVENDPNFCASLRKQFAHLNNVAVHEVSILDFKGKNYDVLISSLPLNSFKAHDVSEILKKYESLVKTGGILSYYEYVGLKRIKRALLFGRLAVDFKDAQLIKNAFANKYGKEIDKIWWNFPPARIIHCKMVKHD